MEDLSNRLVERMRTVARSLADSLVIRFGDRIEGIMVQGSVARGDVHESSDVDMVVFIAGGDRLGYGSVCETFRDSGIGVDVDYVSLDRVAGELSTLLGPDWEMTSSALGDALVLYDRDGRVAKVKRENQGYPLEMRIRNLSYLHGKMQDMGEAVYHAWIREEYRDALVYSRMFAERVLQMMFPLFGVKLSAEKHLLDHGFSLVCDEESARQIRSLLECVDDGQATKQGIDEKLGSIVKISNWVKEKAAQQGLGEALPPEHTKVTKISEALEAHFNAR